VKTESLIDLLARGAGPAPRAVALRRLGPAALAGLLLAIVLAVSLIGPIPSALYATPVPWMKLAYAAALALAAGWLSARLARPVARLVVPARAVAGVVAAMALLGGATLLLLPAAERGAALMGHSWSTCPINVLVLSLPALAGALWALRGLAPTRPRAAGFAAGLLAGAVGAFGYAFACEESSMAFVALWYTLGIGMAGLLGAALGPRVLRW
jgi:hypothetical protein